MGAVIYGVVVSIVAILVARKIKRYRPTYKEMMALVQEMSQSTRDRDEERFIRKMEELKKATDQLHGGGGFEIRRKKNGTTGEDDAST